MRLGLFAPHYSELTQQPLQTSVPQTLLAVEEQAPFYQTDWPQPSILPTQQPGPVQGSLSLLTQVIQPRVSALITRHYPEPTQEPLQFNAPSVLLGVPEAPVPFAQYAWINPEPLPTQESIQHSSFVPLLDRAPVVTRHEWPNPQIPEQRQIQGYQLALSLIVAPPPDKPFAQYEWPQPDPLPTQQPHPDSVPQVITLPDDSVMRLALMAGHHPLPTQQPEPLPVSIALLTGVVGPKPFNQLDWPNPEPLPTQQIDPVQGSLSLITQVIQPRVSALITRHYPEPTQEPLQTNAPVALLDAIPGPKPFLQSDWPNPLIAQQRQHDVTQRDIALLPEPVVGIPFIPIDWPNPQTREFEALASQAIHIARFTPEVLPFFQLDWPNPEPLPTQEPLQTNAPAALLTGPPPTKPFLQSDWPNPIDVRWEFLASQIVTTARLYPEVAPFFQHDWPNPEIQPVQLQTQPVSSIAVLTAPPPTKPFLQSDWPNPIDIRFDNLAAHIVVSVRFEPEIAPFFNTDWPNPEPLLTQQPIQPASSIAALTAPPPTKPFLQSEWPQPEPLPTQQPQDIEVSLALLVAPPPVKPPQQIEWPNPQIPEQRQVQDVQLSLALTFVPEPLPFNKYDWPNPLIPHGDPPLQSGSSYALIGDAGEKPFAQYEWPQPEPASQRNYYDLKLGIGLPGITLILPPVVVDETTIITLPAEIDVSVVPHENRTLIVRSEERNSILPCERVVSIVPKNTGRK